MPDFELLATRFMRKWSLDAETGCWQWHAAKTEKGYGHLGFERRVEKAHRIAWMLHVGQIPDGAHVLHRCDNPSCVNPGHLFLGTNGDNIADKVSKSRQRGAVGERNSHSVLTRDRVDDLRRKVAGGKSASAVAREFGISVSTACRIVRGELWA